MDLRQLRYFLGIVEHGSISKAADELHVAQSAVSLHLNRLEKELGCSLVHRTSRGIVPTESGIRLARRARSILADVGTIADEVRGHEAAPSGNVVVGMPTSLGIVLTVPLAIQIRQICPLIQLRVVEGLSGHMLEWLLSGELDIALIFGSDDIAGVAKEHIAEEPLNLVGPRSANILSGGGEVPACEAFRLPLILPGRPHGLREEVERAASLQGQRLNVILEIDSLEHIKELVAQDVGYTVLSQRVAVHGSTALKLRHRLIVSPRIERSIHLARSSTRPLSSAAAFVSAALSKMVASREDCRIDIGNE